MLTIIESELSAWMVIATDGELRIYSRENAEEWLEVSLENSEPADRDKSLMLEELYGQQGGQEEDDEEPDEPDADEDEDEEVQDQEEDEDEDEESNEAEGNEPEEEPEQPRRRRASASRGK